jgi:hypothetical protein
MWIFLGCALAARQWERVWQRATERGPGARAGSSLAADGRGARLGRAELGAPDRPGKDDSGQKRARFWTETARVPA